MTTQNLIEKWWTWYIFDSIVSTNYVNKVTVNVWLRSYILLYDLFRVIDLMSYIQTSLLYKDLIDFRLVAKTCLVWQDAIMMKYIDISVVPYVWRFETLANEFKYVLYAQWALCICLLFIVFYIVKTVKELLLFLQNECIFETNTVPSYKNEKYVYYVVGLNKMRISKYNYTHKNMANGKP